jgi:hypothetical protein
VGASVAAQHYSAHLGQYFGRPPRSMGQDIRGEAGSERQGAWICFAADVRDNCLYNVGFRAFACPHIIAGCHRIAEQLEGAGLEVLPDVPLDDLKTEFNIPIEKAGKLLILKDAINACYEDYQAKLASS